MHQPEQERWSHKEQFDLLYLFASAHAMCVYPFIRRRFGIEAFRVGALSALLMILLFGLSGSPYVFWYFCAWLLLVIVHRISAVARERRGEGELSRYDGFPWLSLLVSRKGVKELGAKKQEWAFPLVAGLLFGGASPELGWFLIVAGVSMVFKLMVCNQIDRQELRRMQDAAIRQRMMAERLRGQQRDSW